MRVLMSMLPGSRIRAGPKVLQHDFSYDNVPFKTGDVIAFR